MEAALDAPEGRVAGLTALAVWLRLAAMRKLTWNRNYNVKPREISAAQVSYMNSVDWRIRCSHSCTLTPCCCLNELAYTV